MVERVVLRIEKRFNRLERILARLFALLERNKETVGYQNSMLWQLCDGKTKFQDICKILDSLYHEDIKPVIHRTAAGVSLMKTKNLMTILDQEFTGMWDIDKGITPKIRC